MLILHIKGDVRAHLGVMGRNPPIPLGLVGLKCLEDLVAFL